MVEKLFSVFGMKLEQSQAGKISRQIFQQMGGAQGCRVFKIEGVRELLQEFKPHEWFDNNAALSRIANLDPENGNRPRFEKYKHLVVEYMEGRPRERTPRHASYKKASVNRRGCAFTSRGRKNLSLASRTLHTSKLCKEQGLNPTFYAPGMIKIMPRLVVSLGSTIASSSLSYLGLLPEIFSKLFSQKFSGNY